MTPSFATAGVARGTRSVPASRRLLLLSLPDCNGSAYTCGSTRHQSLCGTWFVRCTFTDCYCCTGNALGGGANFEQEGFRYGYIIELGVENQFR